MGDEQLRGNGRQGSPIRQNATTASTEVTPCRRRRCDSGNMMAPYSSGRFRKTSTERGQDHARPATERLRQRAREANPAATPSPARSTRSRSAKSWPRWAAASSTPGFCDRHAGEIPSCTHLPDCSIRPVLRQLQTVMDQVLGALTLKSLLCTEHEVTWGHPRPSPCPWSSGRTDPADRPASRLESRRGFRANVRASSRERREGGA